MESLHQRQVGICRLGTLARSTKYLLLSWFPVETVEEPQEGAFFAPTIRTIVSEVEGVSGTQDTDRYTFAFTISHCFDTTVVLERIQEALKAKNIQVVEPPEKTLLFMKAQEIDLDY